MLPHGMIWIIVCMYFSQEGKSHGWCPAKELVPVALFGTGCYSTTAIKGSESISANFYLHCMSAKAPNL